MQKKYKIGLIVLIVLLSLIIAFAIFNAISNPKSDTPKLEQLDEIKEYGYTLDKRDTKLMKKTFDKLKKELKKEDINYEEYAKLLSQLYVIDLFTLSNKINKYDIPSLEYIMEDNNENFSNNISDTIYKYIIDNSDKKRKQDLPEVASIEFKNIETIEYTYDKNNYEGYKVDLEWTYVKSLGYDTSAMIRLIKIDKKLYVVGYEPSEVTNEENN